MKKINLLFVLALATLAVSDTRATAAPTANSNYGREYFVGSSSLDRWSTGVSGGAGDRSLSRGGGSFDMDFGRGLFYVGYDVFRWVTAYGALAVKDVKFNNVEAEESFIEQGLGLHFNLLDHEIMDPTLIEDRLRVNADVYMGFNETDWAGRTLEWQELAANLTVSIVNDLEGNPYFSPFSMALYAGPAYSNLESDDFETDETFGYIVGLEVFLTHRVSFDMSMTKYDEQTFMGSVSVRF